MRGQSPILPRNSPAEAAASRFQRAVPNAYDWADRRIIRDKEMAVRRSRGHVIVAKKDNNSRNSGV